MRRAEIERRGHEYITLDIDSKFGCNLTADIFDMSAEKLGYFDFVWASVPCEAFSVAAIGHHWGGGAKAYLPKTPHAVNISSGRRERVMRAPGREDVVGESQRHEQGVQELILITP